MREEALRTVLLVKAIEETDRAGTLLPLADRAAATRDAARAAGAAATPELDVEAAALPGKAQRVLAARAALLRRQLGTRHPFVETVLALSSGPGWVGRLLLAAGLLLGFSLSALDGTRRIDVLAIPLLGLLLWNLLVYLLVIASWVRALLGQPRRRPVATGLLARAALRPIGRLVARSAKFNAALAEALGRFLGEWSETARPLLLARMARLFHLSAAAVALGLIAGLYLRGMVLDYRAGWASTFLDASQVHALLSVLYGPASSALRIPIPDVAQLAAMRWEGGRGGVGAAPWIHLIAGTALLFIVLPRLLLASLATLQTWRYALRAPLPAALVPYFRSAFSGVESPHEVGLSLPINVNFETHTRGRRIRCGRRRSSRLRASSSLAGAARFARRSWKPRTKIAVAKVPSATVGSPRSIRQSVSRLTKRRAAISLVEMPRLRRASARSRPNLRSAWAAGNGIEPVFDRALASCMPDAKSIAVRLIRR